MVVQSILWKIRPLLRVQLSQVIKQEKMVLLYMSQETIVIWPILLLLIMLQGMMVLQYIGKVIMV